MSKNKNLYAAWLAVPAALRQPGTQDELAALLDLKPETLRRWEKDTGVLDLVFEKARLRLKAALPEIVQVIIDKALGGQVQFVKLALELAASHKGKDSVEPGVPAVGIEQYEAALRKVAEWEVERFGN